MSSQNRVETDSNHFGLLDLLDIIWIRRWWLVGAVILSASSTILYVRELPNYYTATAVVSPAESGSNPLARLSSQYSGIASMAGISVGGASEVSDFEVAKKVLLSQSFLLDFFQKEGRLKDLIAAQRWDSQNNSMIYDSKIYDSKQEVWVTDLASNFDAPQFADTVYSAARSIIALNDDKRTGFLSVSITHISPVVASDWSNSLVRDVNDEMKQKSIKETQRSIEFLRNQIGATAYADLRAALFNLIQGQIERVMLAETREEFIFATIDKAHVPFQAAGPNRRKLAFLGVLFGLSVGVVVILFEHFIRILINQRFAKRS